MPCPNAAEEGVVGTQTIEYGTPQQVPDIALDDGPVGQRETESSTLERNDRSDAEHHGRMLAQRWDPDQRQAGRRQLPVGTEVVRVE